MSLSLPFPCALSHTVFLLLLHIMNPWLLCHGIVEDLSNIYPGKREDVYNE
jgi:hypothetical protein